MKREVMMTALPFAELLERATARPGRGKRWFCPHCLRGKSPALSVDLDQEVFFCHRCGWQGGRRTLEKELGIEGEKPTPVERLRAKLIQAEATNLLEWVRRKRIDTAALLRTLSKAEIDWREMSRAELASGQPVSELVWSRLQAIVEWQERAEARYERVCDIEKFGGELYQEFSQQRSAAA